MQSIPLSTVFSKPLVGLRGLAGTLLLAAGAVSCGGDADPGRPKHVILITLDTVRADYLSCYGATTGDTPAIDQVAREGAVFERAMSASGLTPSSHATILTGNFQYRHGLRVLAAPSGFRLDPDQPTLAKAFKAAGYRTGAIHSAFPVSGYFGFDDGFDHFDSFETKLQDAGDTGKVGWDVATFQRRSDETTRRALDWFTEASEGDEPVFLWLHYWDPHDQVVVPPKDEYEALVYDPASGDLKDESSRRYAAEVRWQDRSLGELFSGLRSLGALDQTLLAITADHGQGLVDGQQIHGWRMHRTLYREQLHVPLILRGPGIQGGIRQGDQVRTADVAPTILDLMGLPPFEGADGISLAARLDGQRAGDLVAYGEQINGYDDNAGMRKKRPEAAFLHMVSDGEWKLIYRPHMPHRSELFHVSVDPRETTSVQRDHVDVYLRLMADLAERNPWVIAPFPERLVRSPGAGQALDGLGYSGTAGGLGVWHWECPEHPDHRSDVRGRHGDGCSRILVPVGTWTETVK